MGNEEKINRKRVTIGLTCFFIGVVLLWLKVYKKTGISLLRAFEILPMVWCIAWSLIGVGAGLLNTRNHNQPKRGFWNFILHIFGYYGFVFVLATFVSLYVAINLSNIKTIDSLIFFGEVISVKFYTLAAIIALSLGFLGLDLNNIVKRISGLKNGKN